MAANKNRTKTERAQQVRQATLLTSQGFTQAEIAKKLGISQYQVSYDLKKARQQLREDTNKDLLKLRNEKIREIRALKFMYYEKYFESAGTTEKVKTEGVAPLLGDGTVDQEKAIIGRIITETTERTENLAYLDKIHWCIDREISLLGIDQLNDIGPMEGDDEPLIVVNFDIENTL